jgi:peptidyl-prolyl cis-trans isomerase SurA
MNRFAGSLLIVITLALSGLAHCEVVDRIIAIVNDDMVTLTELERYVHVEKHGKFVSVNEYFRNIQLRDKLDAFIENLLIKQQAKKLKADVSDKEINSIIENIKKQYLITEEELKEQLKKDNVEYNDFIDGLKTNVLRNKVLSQVISPEVIVKDSDLIAFYNQHINEFREEEYKLKQIFISNNQPDPQKKVMAAYSRLKEGNSFEDTAKAFSDDPSSAEGGDIGYVRSDELIPVLKEALRTVTPGSYTEVVKTPYGFVILKLVEIRKGDTIIFAVVKDKIHERIVQEETEKRYKDYVEKLRKSSYIEVKI